MRYDYKFGQDKPFGGDLLNRVHWRMHRFFDSCVLGDKEKMNVTCLDFTDLIRAVERRKYYCKPPSWLTKLFKSKERKPTGAEKRRRGFKPEEGRNLMVKNMQTVQACRLAEDESYRFVIYPGNLKGLQ